MQQPDILLPPGPGFWESLAASLLAPGRRDYAGMRVVVPTVAHCAALQQALAARAGGPLIPPRICTMASWLALQPPPEKSAADSERLMALYAELRQHAWLKKLFSARANTDLLPLSQTLLALCDELTLALLPAMQAGGVEDRWARALAQLAPAAQGMLSNEAQLVWSVWQAQLDGRDPHAARYAQMLALAARAQEELVWVSGMAPDAFEAAFLAAWAERQPVRRVALDWQPAHVPPACAAAWPELFDDAAGLPAPAALDGVTLYPAASLEAEAVAAAQALLGWLAEGKTRLALVAQDRVAARRVRALLERAQVYVADETGWKLSTTRAAAALAAWFEAVASRADTMGLLDLLKSPFVLAETEGKADALLRIEQALRRANVIGGWSAAQAALAEACERYGTASPEDAALLARLATEAERFRGRRSLCGWLEETDALLDALQMRAALAADPAGEQLLEMLVLLRAECAQVEHPYSFAEWRAFLNLQMESRPYIAPDPDKRVVMLPLNGARLRAFDAAVVIGADAEHLPSQPQETLFFANAVRRELGLETREARQRQQLRDFTELLAATPRVLLCWQAQRNGEPNPVSPWLARLDLALAGAGLAPLAQHEALLPPQRLAAIAPQRPGPRAPALLPQSLSASGYQSLVACPYQFFATRMLGLAGLDELSELPEKRDYGDWLHRVLARYHETLREHPRPEEARAALLDEITREVFEPELARNAGALAFYIRWQQAAPAYLAWANKRQAEGWTFAFGERKMEAPLALADGSQVLLKGRIDRIDQHPEEGEAILDYKTRDADSLKKRLGAGEDHQLAFYGLLAGQTAARAHYVALDSKNEKKGDAEAEDFPSWQQALRDQIGTVLLQIRQGEPLPANGIESTCQYCDVRGLCRKGAW